MEDSFQKIKKFTKLGLIGITLIFILVVTLSGLYTVKDSEQAVVTTFGKVSSIQDAGLKFKIPFIQKVKKLPVQQTYKMEIGYQTTDTGMLEVENESRMITGDFNIINIDFFVEYKISDPIKFLYSSSNPPLILKNLTQGAARSVIGKKTVDDVLTTGKSQIQSEMKEIVQNKLALLDIGLMVLDIKVQDSEPPTLEVVQAFKSVENAKQEKETKINNAQAYQNQKIPEANAEADKIVKDAEAFKEQKINEATGQVSKLNEMYSEYSKFKDVTKTRMYLDTLQKVLPNIETFIDTTDGGNSLYTLPLKPYN